MTYTLDALPPTPTPKDYHRIHFDPSALPPKRIVGLLACQRDPFLKSMKTRIVSAKVASLSAPPPPKGKQNKKKVVPVAASTEGGGAVSGQLWEVETEDTPIFPEGGGQPFDTGKLILEDKNGGTREYLVEGCIRRGLEGVHLVRIPEGEAGLENSEGETVELRVDWDRRVDHMSIHTSQHLLSAILDVHAEGLPTLSWSMSAYPSLDTPYIELPRSLTWAEVEEVEKRCNEVIEIGKNIWVDVDMQEEGFVKTTAAGVRENRGIPTDYKDGVIRHINIDGIDRNACCGTQLPNTTHCQFIHIIPPSTPSTSSTTSKSPTKLYFTAGPRALKYLAQASRNVSLASQVLNTNRSDLVDRLVKTEELRKEYMGKERDLRGELAKILVGGAVERLGVDRGVVWVQRGEKGSHDFDFLGLIVGGFQSGTSEAVEGRGEGKVAEPVIVITSAVVGSPTLLLVYSASNDVAKGVNEKIKAVMEGDEKGRVKGGGARGRYMSKIEGKWGKDDVSKVQGVLDEVRANGL